MMAEIHIGRQIRTGAGSNNGLLEVDSLNRLVTADFQPMGVYKRCTAIDQVYPVTGIELGAQLYLLADHLLRVLQHPREGKPARFADIPEHLIGVEGDDLLHRVTQRLGWNGAPVRAVTAHRRFVFNDGDSLVVLGRVHCRPFTRMAGANNDDVVMMLCHVRSDSLSTS